MNIHETEWGAKDMDEKIEPLKKGKVRHWPFTDVNEQSLRISEQLAARPNVWGVGLWPDEETERIAQKCAEVLANNFGLTAFSFVPEDSLINLIEIWGTDKEGLEWAIRDMEDALGSTLADCAIDLGGDVPFREVVMAIKEGIGRPRPIPKPPLSMKKRWMAKLMRLNGAVISIRLHMLWRLTRKVTVWLTMAWFRS